MRGIGACAMVTLVVLSACGQGEPAPAASTPVEDALTGETSPSADASPDLGTDSAVAPDAASDTSDASEDALDADGGFGAGLDPDGVLMLHPTKSKGVTFRLGTSDANATARFEIERGTKATKKTEGKVTFWNVISHTLSYASGGTGWTSRLHVWASGTKTQLHTWKTQKGWLATPEDPKDQELTVYLRAHEILDAKRAAFSLKIRGGRHSSSDGDLASCTMMAFAGPETSGVARFGKELTHPTYDYVKLAPKVATELKDDVWVGLKLVSFQTAPKSVRYELWIDRTPFDAVTGEPRNAWELFSEYQDEDGKDTGDYAAVADWGGLLTTVRTDGLKSVDFALLSLREITPP